MRFLAVTGATLLALAACSPMDQTTATTRAIVEMPSVEASGPLAPRDECASVPGPATFQIALQQAIATRDPDALLALVDEDVLLDFGGGSGKVELRQRLTSPEYRLWDEIDRAVALGCGVANSADGERYVSWPWYFSKDVIPLDPYESMIVTGADVPLLDGPSTAANQIATVSWDYVQIGEHSANPFVQVVTRAGQKGFMHVSSLRSQVDYRVIANSSKAGWKVTAIVAGD